MFAAKWAPLVAICLGTFMLLLDVTIVNVALPDMVADLDASFSSLQWVMDAYALALASILLGVGTIADRVGRRRVYLIGLGVFGLASLACGLAASAEVLIAARAVQGIGAAGMFATNVALLNGIYQGRDRGVAFGIWGSVVSVAAAIGPLAGGVLTELLSWRWIFFVNVPISLLTILLAARVLSEARGAPGVRLDVPGVLTFTAGAGLATLALVRVSHAGWGSASTVLLLAGSAVALVAFVLIERVTRDPLLDLALLRHGPFAGVLIGAVLLSVAAFGALPYASLWLQGPVQLDPIEAGLVLLPLSVASFLVSAFGGRFLHGAAVRWSIGIGLLAIGAGDLLQTGLDAGSDWTSIVGGMTIVGIGVGLTSPTLVSTGMAIVPPQRSGMAAGAVNTFRQLGLALGIAVLGAVYDGGLDGPEGAAGALSSTLLVAGVLGVAAGVITLLLVRPAGHVERRRVRKSSGGSPRRSRPSPPRSP